MSLRFTHLFSAALCLFVVGCTTREAALVTLDAGPGAPLITDCRDALAAYFRGELAPCDFVGRCSVAAGSCCVQEVVCNAGSVVGLPLFCEPGCVECRDDSVCPTTQICDGSRCRDCPFPPDGSACPPCPLPLEAVVRNGCSTCECRPRSACHADPDCPPGDVCLPGQACAPTCGDPGPLACCANACGAATCPFPVPLGCITECPPGLMCPGPCMTTGCTCDAMSWTCDRICAPPELPLMCMF